MALALATMFQFDHLGEIDHLMIPEPQNQQQFFTPENGITSKPLKFGMMKLYFIQAPSTKSKKNYGIPFHKKKPWSLDCFSLFFSWALRVVTHITIINWIVFLWINPPRAEADCRCLMAGFVLYLCPRKLGSMVIGSMGYNLLVNGIYLGYNLLRS